MRRRRLLLLLLLELYLDHIRDHGINVVRKRQQVRRRLQEDLVQHGTRGLQLSTVQLLQYFDQCLGCL
jgi:hypothetical protein